MNQKTTKYGDIVLSRKRYSELMDAEKLVRKKRMILVLDLAWGRRVIVKTNDDAARYLADRLAVMTRSAHYYSRRAKILSRSRLFNILGRICFGQKKWKQMVK